MVSLNQKFIILMTLNLVKSLDRIGFTFGVRLNWIVFFYFISQLGLTELPIPARCKVAELDTNWHKNQTLHKTLLKHGFHKMLVLSLFFISVQSFRPRFRDFSLLSQLKLQNDIKFYWNFEKVIFEHGYQYTISWSMSFTLQGKNYLYII